MASLAKPSCDRKSVEKLSGEGGEGMGEWEGEWRGEGRANILMRSFFWVVGFRRPFFM